MLGASGCTGHSAGDPLPASHTGGGQTSSSLPPSSDNAANKLAAVDPCTLLTQAQLDQYGLHKRDAGTLVGARICSWAHPTDENGKNGFNLKPAIWDQQGFKDINAEGQIVTDVPTIGRHQVRQAKQANGDACFVSISVTDSSRVDVVVASNSSDESCGLANQFAKLIEPRLPGGAG